MKKIKYLLLIGMILLLAYFRYENLIEKPIRADSTETTSFQIKSGESVDDIANKLKENNLIRSTIAFKIYTQIHDLDTKILAGRFLLSQNMNIPKIVSVLGDPQKVESVITIQEGLRIRDIDKKLADLNLIKAGDFIQEVKDFNGWHYYSFLDRTKLEQLDIPLEGYIYPDTYFLDPNDFSPHDLIYLALDNFENKTATLRAEKSPRTLHELITMASIIENEVFGEQDRKTVSGILWKRLNSNWPIGADATLLYISEDRQISSKDLESDSPYNTRKFQGLPPGPISSPSLESIEAAIHPEESQYWFYLTTLDTGEVIYSKSNEEHNDNKRKYLY